jgi:dUTP pyrophosphatase
VILDTTILTPVEFIAEFEGINDNLEYKNDEDAGFDIQSAESCYIRFGEIRVVKTGLKIYTRLPGFELQIRPRSGLAAKYGLTLVNSPGTIDSGYQNEILLICTVLNNQNYYVNKGDRIAQGVFSMVYRPGRYIITEPGQPTRQNFKQVEAPFVKVKTFSSTSVRGENGLGSSGV